MRRLAHVLGAGVLALTLTACGDDDLTATLATPAPTAAPRRLVAAAPPTTRPTTTTTTSTTTTTTSTPAPTTPPPPTTVASTLPTPVAPPLEDGSSEETWEVGTIEIPALGLWAPMYEGIRLATLNRGPGHWPGTAMPGELGNVVLAGHRTSHNAEFRHLDRLVAGDEVVMHTLAGRFVYHVSSTEIVRPNALWIVDQTPARTATLFACHPPGSVRERIVVHLELATP